MVRALSVTLDGQATTPLSEPRPDLLLSSAVDSLAVLIDSPSGIERGGAVLVFSLGVLVCLLAAEEGIVAIIAPLDGETPVEDTSELHVVAMRADHLTLFLDGFEKRQISSCERVVVASDVSHYCLCTWRKKCARERFHAHELIRERPLVL